MASIMLNGSRCELVRLREDDVKPGTLVRELENRRVFRILCEDGDDLIARNARRPSLVEAIPREIVLREYLRVIPAP